MKLAVYQMCAEKLDKCFASYSKVTPDSHFLIFKADPNSTLPLILTLAHFNTVTMRQHPRTSLNLTPLRLLTVAPQHYKPTIQQQRLTLIRLLQRISTREYSFQERQTHQGVSVEVLKLAKLCRPLVMYTEMARLSGFMGPIKLQQDLKVSPVSPMRVLWCMKA